MSQSPTRRATIATAKSGTHRCQLQPGTVVLVRVVRVSGDIATLAIVDTCGSSHPVGTVFRANRTATAAILAGEHRV